MIKLEREWQIALGSWLLAWIVRGLAATVRRHHDGDAAQRALESSGSPYILACWHRHLLLMPKAYGGRRISIMISQHRDGELAARAAARLGIGSTRGSTTRGGVAALWGLLKKARAGWDLAFAPDGPKGPPEVAKAGVVLAAAATGLPVVPVAFAASRYRCLGSWDRMIVPLPGARVCFAHGEPLSFSRETDTEEGCRLLEERLGEVGRRAEALVTPGGKTS
ncbi:MAG: lysophospholipid acyltransferase family protein [Acidobacteriota bacterium]